MTMIKPEMKEKKKLQKLKETAQCFAVVHAELSPPRRPAYRSPSRYVGEKGKKLEALRLKSNPAKTTSVTALWTMS
jgi:hypothetical protein